jgi:hypothetical protein
VKLANARKSRRVRWHHPQAHRAGSSDAVLRFESALHVADAAGQSARLGFRHDDFGTCQAMAARVSKAYSGYSVGGSFALFSGSSRFLASPAFPSC